MITLENHRSYDVSKKDLDIMVAHSKEHARLCEHKSLVGVGLDGQLQVGYQVLELIESPASIEIHTQYGSHPVWVTKTYHNVRFLTLLTWKDARTLGYATLKDAERYGAI